MTIRQLHEAKLHDAQRAMERHRRVCKDETEECMVCESIAQEIERNAKAISRIAAGMRQMRIANQ